MLLSGCRPEIDEPDGLETVGADIVCLPDALRLVLQFAFKPLETRGPVAAVGFTLTSFVIVGEQVGLVLRACGLANAIPLGLQQFFERGSLGSAPLGQVLNRFSDLCRGPLFELRPEIGEVVA